MKIIYPLSLVVLGSIQSISQSPKMNGAWISVSEGTTTVYIYSDRHFVVSIFSKEKFIETFGGTYQMEGAAIKETIEFSTRNPDQIGTMQRTSLFWNKAGDEFKLSKSESVEPPFRCLDNGTPGKLAGAWLITGRFNNGEMRKNTPGARRTMKILSGTRFQWIAYNVETKEFSATGGGTYTTENGKYTENIEFFSRDQSRVGASLEFDFLMMEDGGWRHSGKSSKGDPIDEVWSQREKLGM